MKAYVFPGQGAQFEGMGKDMYDASHDIQNLFKEADHILGYGLSEIMFTGTSVDLQQTRITQPAIFLHSIAKIQQLGSAFQPEAVTGHSLGEISALVACRSLSFKQGLQLVYERAEAMQEACEMQPGTMAAVLGLDDAKIETIVAEVDGVLVPANYNSPGQLVISGTKAAIEAATPLLQAAGAKRVVLLPVGGAFHSPLMQPAAERLSKAILKAEWKTPICPIWQNVTATSETNPEQIKTNLRQQLTGPVKWTQTIQNMSQSGVGTFIEAGGTGNILRGLIKKIQPDAITEQV